MFRSLRKIGVLYTGGHYNMDDQPSKTMQLERICMVEKPLGLAIIVFRQRDVLSD